MLFITYWLMGILGECKGDFMELSRREFKIPLVRPLLTFGRDRKSVPVRHEDKAINSKPVKVIR